ncbi:CPSase L D2 and Carboxyl trans and Biotin lipoyl and Biotin carb C and CPSase L chain and ACC central domain containing protein [Trichuris trichiura]|uniref:CPSase L D2 and Carboxyl trans and Biotin lipoyl and Biotin carb C and CPSase L chain and ACC central domain containing protein n=1 Tax=Trichuris trichiura TaxID=36087 RepID=A0A077YY51_TRITR|nr:CPSase L D2 and Carboxyl trans and Biotin lipoyl and Biotin carb C and CPSase L chain and ACC central domain containing protein [Trichuris trichiura]
METGESPLPAAGSRLASWNGSTNDDGPQDAVDVPVFAEKSVDDSANFTNKTMFNLGANSEAYVGQRDSGISSISSQKFSSTSSAADSPFGIRPTMSSPCFTPVTHGTNLKKVFWDRRESSGCGAVTPDQFVRQFDGTTVITKVTVVLIANNGIAAVKCMRSIRRWAYEMFRNDRAIKFVAMVTPEDLKANAEYIRMADQFVCIPGGSNNNNYANIHLILDMAIKMEVQAVWAGWGHASENPNLPDLLEKHNIVFIGPPAKAMWALGDKIASSIVAQTANIPTLPWSGSDLALSAGEGNLVNSSSVHDLYVKATVTTLEKGLKAASKIGLPLMIKASEGGGGKGIRKCENLDDFPTQFRQVQAEVPGSPIFIMKLAKGARHLEVQVLADCYGNADAVKLAKMVCYVSAGTVEYLYIPESQQYYFLELNPRLQVEHPCTEMVANINLPAAQLQIAMGIPLHRIKDIRLLYGAAAFDDKPLDFDSPPLRPTPRGHVIAARITSENPDDGFQPSSGTVQELNFRSSKNAWGYFSVSASGGLHEFADSQFGHCFSWGETRDDAIANMVLALKELSIRGDFRTTVEYLITLLETEAFINNQFDTEWLDTLIAEKVQTEKPDVIVGVVCLSVLIADVAIVNAFQNFQNSLERGQVLPAKSLIETVDVELTHEGVSYTVEVTRSGPQSYFLMMNGSGVQVEFHRMSDGGMLLSLNSDSYTCYMKEEVNRYRVQIGNKTIVFEKNYDPTELRSPSAGKLLQYLVEDGAHVFALTPYAEIEVMKMVMTLTTPESGCVHYLKRPGTVLNPGSVIAKMSLDDPSRMRTAVRYEGTFPIHSPVTQHAEKLYQTYRELLSYFNYVLDGYTLPEPYFSPDLREKVANFFRVLKDPALPLFELQEAMSVIGGRIPAEVETRIRNLMTNYAGNITSVLCRFPSQQIAQVLDEYATSLSKKQSREMFFMSTHGLLSLVQRYRDGIRGHMKLVLQELFLRYLNVEKHFQQQLYDKSVHALRESLKDGDMRRVTNAIFSHFQLPKKNQVIISLIEHISSHEPGLTDELKEVLNQLTNFGKADHGKVALRARQVLIAAHQPSYDSRHNQVESIFLSALDKYGHSFQPENLYKLITSETSICDVLHDFFFHSNEIVRMAALEVYVRRTYIAFEVNCLKHHVLGNSVSIVEYQFTLPSSHPDRVEMPKSCPSFRNDVNRLCNTEDDFNGLEVPTSFNCQSVGLLVAFGTFEEAKQNFNRLLGMFSLGTSSRLPADPNRNPARYRSIQGSKIVEEQEQVEFLYILNIAVRIEDESGGDDAQLAEMFQKFCLQNKVSLTERRIRRVSFIALCRRWAPKYFIFRGKDNYMEDKIYRHLEPAMAFQLEINRMKNFHLETVPTANSKLHLYLAKAKSDQGQQVFKIPAEPTFFSCYIEFLEASFDYLRNEGERVLLESLDELEVAFNSHPDARRCDCNHIFLNFVPCVTLDPQKVVDTVSEIIVRYGVRLWKLRVLQAELKYSIRLIPHGPPVHMRLTICNESGYYLDLQLYQEVLDKATGQLRYASWDASKPGPLNGLAVSTPYQTKDHMQQKRYLAQKMGTTYVYDFPEMFRQALIKLWREYNAEIGMVVWRLTLKTPEYVDGRDIIVVANDMTYFIGSFGVKEDELFLKASQLSRKLKIPRIYVAANSGARIGLATEVRSCFKIAWNDALNPDKGFKYLYLTQEDFKRLNSCMTVVRAEKIEDEGEIRYKLTDIIGREESIGVENLKGSGLIAGETSLAYDEVCLISLVSCRTVGIGAYLVRLAQRTIQVENSHIILTGAPALNKLLGREVYTSNNQLGGTQIMHNNGVSHAIAQNDFEGVYLILKWLSYIPAFRGAPLPVLTPIDPVEREITFYPTKNPYDPRWMFEGRPNPLSPTEWESGFFDRGSWCEIMSGWARTVVCGRARLGGIPCSVIAVETRTVEVQVPADPATLDSESKVISQAGQVWFPDSAYKTAQAISDFNREQLPLFIFANWRGFSGGMKDMFDQVLKFGAYIVDGLRSYRQPVFIYIPPNAELRGGAWVVVDPAINSRYMEMYADPDARGGVLEPEGTVEIKYRERDLISTINRCDPVCLRILKKLHKLEQSGDSEAKAKLQKSLTSRVESLLPLYHTVAVHFADLHDRAGRMQEKNVITGVVEWKKARRKFYWRLRRRLAEETVMQQIVGNCCGYAMDVGEMNFLLPRWYALDPANKKCGNWNDDQGVAVWLENQLSQEGSIVSENLKCLKRDSIIGKIRSTLSNSPDLLMDAVLEVAQQLNSHQSADLIKVLSNLSSRQNPSRPST